jgi:hypothetical protein
VPQSPSGPAGWLSLPELGGARARPRPMRPSWVAIVFAVQLIVAACTGGAEAPTPLATGSPGSSGSPGPTVGPLPTPADHDLSTAELKYRLLEVFAPLSYCDPDEYPVPHDDEPQKAEAAFPTIQADSATFTAILDRLGLSGRTDFSADDKLATYRQWKQLNAIALTSVAGDGAAFDLLTETDPGMGQGVRSKGTIDARGAVVVQSSEPAFLTACPICLSRGTLIAAPLGEVAVEALAVGDAVWTVDALGGRVVGTVAAIGHVSVPSTHEVIHLVLDDGRELWASPGHPLAGGRWLGDLRAGAWVDGARIVSAQAVTYGQPFTYDLLPSGSTGLYWANGVLLGSTLRRPAP